MADDQPKKSDENNKKVRKLKKAPQSFREQVEKKSVVKVRAPRLRKAASAATTPFKTARRLSKKEIHLSPKKAEQGKFLHKSRSPIPGYFRNSWKELKQVTWTPRREAIRLTVAVLLFATIFGAVIAITDYGLDNLFRKVILK